LAARTAGTGRILKVLKMFFDNRKNFEITCGLTLSSRKWVPIGSRDKRRSNYHNV